MSESFAQALACLRTARGYSQGQLARACRVDPSYLSRLEGGSRAPSPAALAVIAARLDLDASERARLLAAAGFRAMPPSHWICFDRRDEPLLAELATLLNEAPVPVRARLRDELARALAHLKGAAA